MSDTNGQGAPLDQAIMLYRQGRYGQVRSVLRALIARTPGDVSAWSLLGYLERDVGEARAAAAAFDRALELQPRDIIARKARARVALERSEADVLDRYAAALAAAPGDPMLMLEQAEAKLGLGIGEAIDEFAGFVARHPDWTEGQVALARMRWEERKDQAFADDIRRLLRAEPGRLDLWWELGKLLAHCGMHEQAADAARGARDEGGGGDDFLLLEGVEAGRAGDLHRADALLAALPANYPGRSVHDGMHLIRRQHFDSALAAIEAALAENPRHVEAWALAELLYRKLGDPRSQWLSNREGLVRAIDLALTPEQMDRIEALLQRLQLFGVQAVEQTVRHGTQTRWRLFDRTDPELGELRQALEAAIGEYVAALPAADEHHPLLRHKNDPLTITGSWSVRLAGSGHHVSHTHPLGLISSACYFKVPDSAASTDEGHLELGRPPPDLLLDLPPLHTIAPVRGRLVLFPSYLFHGTRPFASGERLSVAFDVNLHPEAES